MRDKKSMSDIAYSIGQGRNRKQYQSNIIIDVRPSINTEDERHKFNLVFPHIHRQQKKTIDNSEKAID